MFFSLHFQIGFLSIAHYALVPVLKGHDWGVTGVTYEHNIIAYYDFKCNSILKIIAKYDMIWGKYIMENISWTSL